MAIGDYKKKRKTIGRPKELESIMRRLDQGLVTTIDRAQEDLPLAYQAIHDVLVAKDSSPTNKFSAAKWIIEFNEKAFKQLMEDKEKELLADEAVNASEEEEEAPFVLDFGQGNAPNSNKTVN